MAADNNNSNNGVNKGILTAAAVTVTVKGGDYADCLSSDDIDRILLPELGRRTLPADTFYHLARGEDIKVCIQDGMLCVVHVRHHWVLAMFGHGESWRVWDSAPSFAVQRDLGALARQIRRHPPVFVTCPQQLRGSNECGVFAIAFALMLHRNVAIPAR